jgi:hypothetical protein
MLNEEPAQSQDLQMMGMLLPLGIEKGKDFKPDVATVARLNSAAAEAHAWLLAQIPTFVTNWWPGRRQAAGEFADRRVATLSMPYQLSALARTITTSREKVACRNGPITDIQPPSITQRTFLY